VALPQRFNSLLFFILTFGNILFGAATRIPFLFQTNVNAYANVQEEQYHNIEKPGWHALCSIVISTPACGYFYILNWVSRHLSSKINNKAINTILQTLFLSTHPSHDTRIADIKKWMPEAMKYYKRAGVTPKVKKTGTDASKPVTSPKQPGTPKQPSNPKKP
jgi:hypothetical protein